MPTWKRFTELPIDFLSSSELTIEFFFCALLASIQCPLGRDLQNSNRVFVCNCVLPT
jgi:hypothetical protein